MQSSNENEVVKQTTPPLNDNKSKGSGSKALMVLLALATAGLGIFSFNLYNEKKKNSEELNKQKEQMITELNALKSDYDRAVDDNVSVNQELRDAREKITLYIDSLKKTKADVAALWKYRNQVQVLTKERNKLLAINDSLRRSNAFITQQRDSISLALQDVSSMADSLVEQNSKLAQVLESGAQLQITRLQVEAVKERSGGRYANTNRARPTDKIRVCFTVAANKLAESGNRHFYVQLISPNGVTMGENNTTSTEAITINYSTVSDFLYENKLVDVCEFIGNGGGRFEKGNYQVKVFNDKLNLIGESEFKLK
ncbi:hypothetical protein ACILFN_10165 [Capnocytophaga canimorsus]|uniref:hypothetical protein n=1 Tax=Capnocytophaga canimorsus TaxID=28188 RepID=UPI0037D152FC